MYSIAKYASRAGSIGKPLPAPFATFDFERVQFRHGATSMIAGQPGAFKSVFGLNMLVRWAQAGLSAVYFSADSDEFTVAKRCIGIVSDIDIHQAERDLNSPLRDGYLSYLNVLERVRFEYRATDMDGIAEKVAAFEQVNGDFPDVVFIDNLMDFVDSGDDWARMRTMTRDLDGLARETRSHVVVLHHAGEGGRARPGEPVPRSDIQGKVSQKSRLTLTVAADYLHLMVACVKNTNGPQYPNAERHMDFIVHPSMRVTEHERHLS